MGVWQNHKGRGWANATTGGQLLWKPSIHCNMKKAIIDQNHEK